MLTRRHAFNRAQTLLTHHNHHHHHFNPHLHNRHLPSHISRQWYSIRSSLSQSTTPSSPPTTTAGTPPPTLTTTTSISIPQDELSRLNRTTANLYRILLRCIRMSTPPSSNVADDGKKKTTMLQPSLNPQDYGQARILDAAQCSIWSRQQQHQQSVDANKMNNTTIGISSTAKPNDTENEEQQHIVAHKIVAFFRQWNNNGITLTEIQHELNAHAAVVDPLLELTNDEFDFYPDRTLLVSRNELQKALRLAFLRLVDGTDDRTLSYLPGDTDDDDDNNDDVSNNETKTHDTNSSSSSSSFVLSKAHVVDLHRFAIESIKLTEEQAEMWDSTSVTVDWERGIQVVASSRYIGMAQNGNIFVNGHEAMAKPKHRFMYRIRIEKFSAFNNNSTTITNNSTIEIDTDETKDKRCAVQLLGRTWNIIEDGTEDDQEGTNDNEGQGAVVTVRAPTTGVVGHLPVLRDGEIFEYMSGCELATRTGMMDGNFHMAWVDYDTTDSAKVGDPVEALNFGKEEKFVVKVAPFRLMVLG